MTRNRKKAMLVSDNGRPSPRNSDEIIDVILSMDLDPQGLRAEIELYDSDTFEPLSGWGADIIRRGDHEVIATAIGFSTRGDVRAALLDAGIGEVIFLD
jgi:hypothetical protein